MTEFFIVPYPQNRRVFVDGGPNGRTNRVQSIERGSHTFDLGVPADYMPDAHFTFVGGTSFENPEVIAFVPVAGAAVSLLDAAPPPVKKRRARKKPTRAKRKKRRRVKHR